MFKKNLVKMALILSIFVLFFSTKTISAQDTGSCRTMEYPAIEGSRFCLPNETECGTEVSGDGISAVNRTTCCTTSNACLLHRGIICANGNLNTAIGCIPFGSNTSIASFFLIFAIGLAGGISIILILYAGFQITTSTGDPKKIQGGKALLNSALAGLVMIIFSIFLLRLIGTQVIGIF